MSALRGRLPSLTSVNKSDSTNNLTIFICSWNVSTIQPNFDLSKLIKFPKKSSPDICVFGLQEVNSKPWQRIIDYFYNDPWTNELTFLLSELGYIRIKSTRLVGILLNVFVKREYVGHVRYSIEDWIRLGYFGLWGNKGANLCTLNIGGMNICFINSHLSAHEYQSKKRQLEYSAILHSHKNNTNDHTDTIPLNEDYQFIFGDLNFRIEGLPIDIVKELIQKKEYEKLLGFDQLSKCMKNKESFFNLQESQIHFPPTYKFDPNTHTYDTSTKRRVPSWCDRILYKVDKKEDEAILCEQLLYSSIPEMDQSDHKPVYSLFNIKVGNLDLQVSGIWFDKILFNGRDIEISYEINGNIVTSDTDWIGLYKEKFMATDDYVTYVMANRVYEFENKKLKKDVFGSNENIKVVKKKSMLKGYYVQKNGIYVVAYYSTVCRQLISISSQFEVQME